MNAPLTDDELLDLLSDALEPAPARPTLPEHEQLRRALAAECDLAEGQPNPHKVRSLGRLPHPVAAVVVVAALTTGGAAAAVKTDTLPGPLRTLASDVGIPVTSPALQQVDNDLAALHSALNAGDADVIRAEAAALNRDLDALDPDDRITVDGEVNLLLAQAGGWLVAHQSVAGSHIDRGDGSAATGGVSGGGHQETHGGSGTPEEQQNSSDTDHGGNDSAGGTTASGGSTGSGPGPGGTNGDADQDGGRTTSGKISVTGQTPVTATPDGGGGSAGSDQGGSGSPGVGGRSSSSSGGTSSTPGGSGDLGAPETPASGGGGGGDGGG